MDRPDYLTLGQSFQLSLVEFAQLLKDKNMYIYQCYKIICQYLSRLYNCLPIMLLKIDVQVNANNRSNSEKHTRIRKLATDPENAIFLGMCIVNLNNY